MPRRLKLQEMTPWARDLGHETDGVLLMSLHTGLRVVWTMCILAEQGTGQDRAYHLREAEKGFQAVLEITKRINLRQRDRDAIEQARQNISLIVGMTPL
jgi:hypothetical protein